MSINQIEFTNDQKNALQIIVDWWNTINRKQCICISGAAGTGKTTLIAKLPSYLKTKFKPYVDIAYATLTAKASLVLRNKGIPASTIHSLIYDTKIIEDKITHRVKYQFKRKSALAKDLIIIDEASMVSDSLYSDLKSFGIPILFIGDKFQLPPINSEFNLMDDRFLSYSMTQIVRQQSDNLIITMATKLRNREQTPFIKHPQFTKISKKYFDLLSMNKYDQIITGKNKTRIDLNQFYRKEILHFNSSIPVYRDKVIFLKNNYEDYVFNGQQVILDKDLEPCGKNLYTLTGTDIVNKEGVCVDVVTDFINTLPIDVQKKRYNKVIKGKNSNIIDYAYVISCHKCVSGNTKIFTDNGIIRIKDYNGEKVFDGTDFVYPKEFIRNGLSKVKTIITHNGYTNTTTLNHNHIVLNQERQIIKKKTNELKIGDKFLIAKNIKAIKKNYLKIKTKYIHHIVDQQFAEWLGLFLVNGQMFTNIKFEPTLFYFSSSKKEIIQKIKSLSNTLFNVKDQIKKQKNYYGYCFTYKINDINVVREICKICKFPLFNIPKEIFSSKNSVQKAFLKGIFEVFDTNNIYLKHDKYIIKNIQTLLLNNQIISKIKPLNKFEYSIQISGKYIDDFKNIILDNKNINTKNSVNMLQNYEIDTIQKISEEFETETYCFQIENSHMFVQNGILSGNSQGSEWDNVLVMDDYFFYGNEEMRYRWLYTAITRASKSVTWAV